MAEFLTVWKFGHEERWPRCLNGRRIASVVIPGNPSRVRCGLGQCLTAAEFSQGMERDFAVPSAAASEAQRTSGSTSAREHSLGRKRFRESLNISFLTSCSPFSADPVNPPMLCNKPGLTREICLCLREDYNESHIVWGDHTPSQNRRSASLGRTLNWRTSRRNAFLADSSSNRAVSNEIHGQGRRSGAFAPSLPQTACTWTEESGPYPRHLGDPVNRLL